MGGFTPGKRARATNEDFPPEWQAFTWVPPYCWWRDKAATEFPRVLLCIVRKGSQHRKRLSRTDVTAGDRVARAHCGNRMPSNHLHHRAERCDGIWPLRNLGASLQSGLPWRWHLISGREQPATLGLCVPIHARLHATHLLQQSQKIRTPCSQNHPAVYAEAHYGNSVGKPPQPAVV